MILTVIAICFLILLHETGHFFVARYYGIGVAEFSVGFGKPVFQRSRNGTMYSLRLFPLGGYVKLDEEFYLSSPATRIKVASAGPAANLIFACMSFIVVSFVGLPQLTSKIGQVFPGRPAANSGILPGDRVIAVNGRQVVKWSEMTALVTEGKGSAVHLKVQRGQRFFDLATVPENIGGKGMLGVKASGETVSTPYGPLASIKKGAQIASEQLKASAILFLKLIGFAPVDVMGPVQIVKAGAEQMAFGWVNLLFFVAVLSANFVTFNLIPIPVLDGGLILIALVEMITGRRIGKKTQFTMSKISMAVIAGVIVFVLLKDLLIISQ